MNKIPGVGMGVSDKSQTLEGLFIQYRQAGGTACHLQLPPSLSVDLFVGGNVAFMGKLDILMGR